MCAIQRPKHLQGDQKSQTRRHSNMAQSIALPIIQVQREWEREYVLYWRACTSSFPPLPPNNKITDCAFLFSRRAHQWNLQWCPRAETQPNLTNQISSAGNLKHEWWHPHFWSGWNCGRRTEKKVYSIHRSCPCGGCGGSVFPESCKLLLFCGLIKPERISVACN